MYKDHPRNWSQSDFYRQMDFKLGKTSQKYLCLLLPNFFYADPTLCLGIFTQALLKSGPLFYIDYRKKYFKKKFTYRHFFFSYMQQETQLCVGFRPVAYIL